MPWASVPLALALAGPPVAPRSLELAPVVDRITIDGRADERTWRATPPSAGFVERRPALGATPEHPTSVRMAYDEEALYVLVESTQPPESLVTRTLRRDATGLFSDDNVFVKLDPHHDRRTSYLLGINSAGTQLDVLALDNGAVQLREWDGVWEAEARVHASGWTAELRIPLATLGLHDAESSTMGLDVSRHHARRAATYDWQLMPPPRTGVEASELGTLTGLRALPRTFPVVLRPYGLVRSGFDRRFDVDPRTGADLATGGDLRVGFGRGSTATLSLRTDFSQVEVDEVQIPVDRFPLFFPERRAFFLEDADIFHFGVPRKAQLLFTRRIGLAEGRPVPLLGGLKLAGREGRVSYGLLEVRSLPWRRDDGSLAPGSDMLVARARVRVAPGTYVGAIAIGERVAGPRARHGGSAGLDVQLVTAGGRLFGSGFVAGALPVPEAGERGLAPGTSAHAAVGVRGLYVRPGVSWLWSSRRFTAPQGFYRRPGTAEQRAELLFAPRPRVLGLSEVVFGPDYTLTTSPDYRRALTREPGASIEAWWRNGSRLRYEVAYVTDEVDAPFELYGHRLPAGTYRGLRHRVRAGSPPWAAVRVDPEYEARAVYGDPLHVPSLGVEARLGRHVALRAVYGHVLGRLGPARVPVSLGWANGQLELALTRDLSLDVLGRLGLSPGAEQFGLQARMRWRLAPGSDLFLVYGNAMPLRGAEVPTFHELTLKLSWHLAAAIPRRQHSGPTATKGRRRRDSNPR